ncbi:two-partner secretion domain-containing protein [Mitsuokella multacida]|uniref:two-partner secretion domain-containing protein n=1 Tax=Mitsuokella multacida TaxID=52226 RepID=UPI003F60B663
MRRRKTWQRQAAAITAAMMAMSVGGIAYAMPQGEVIRSGKGEITRQDKDMTVNQDSKRLAIDWSGFDIANDERVTFRQPDKDSVALNRVVGDAASVIDGTLSGNGHVYVINPNGVLFGKNASVDVGSLVASTARISDSDMTNFANADGITMAIPEDSSAKVINAGTIRAEGGLVVLHAAEVENSGTITNPEGTTALAAARNLSLSADTAGKINFTVDGALAKAKALNSGVLKADGGYLVMTARSAGDVMSTVVNNTGTMEAKTLRQNEKGEILLDGGDNGIVELNGTLDVSGMEAGQSAGSIKAIGAETHVEDGATLHAIGAVDGGLIETSGDYLEIGDNVDIDAAGKTGEAGEWLLDPLDVVISSEKPDNATNASGGPTYSLGNVTNASMTSWVDSATVNRLLSNGTSVRVESADRNKAASISVDSAIEKTGKREASFTLEAQRNITINKDITAQDGKLNVILNSDTDGDAIGAVIINADITTNGGYFTSGSGGDRHYTSYNSLVGAGNPSKGTVGTYFGNGGTTGNRSVTTNGGDVNLYGDVAIGLNGGTLTIDTAKANGTGGAVNITGTIESGNSYTLYYQGKAGWDDLVKKYATEHGVGRTATKYTGTGSKTISRGDIYCVISEDGLSVTWYKARKGSAVIGTTQYTDYTSSQVTVYDKYNDKAYDALSSTEKANLSHRIANSWEAAKWLAQNGTGGGSTVNDTYLATITSSLENSLAAPTGEIPLFVGGKGSGSSVNPADPDHSDGYYWVTGPEGEAPGGKGTKFADNSGTPLPNYYAKWHTGRSEASHSTTTEPNNSGPYVTVGYGVTSNWDDVATSAGTTKGFVQEKNLAHSGLEVQAGSGQVDLKGNAGLSVGLKNLTINTTGNVTVGGGRSAAGTTYTGQIRTDEGVSIHGADVTVGDRITSINNGVNIQATGNIHVDGITAHDKINLTTTGADGVIVLGSEHNDGSLNTASTENDAVIIDARGANGAFKNQTSAEHAITTGEGGNWKVYSASPDRDTFGTNLNSETTARWHASSQGGNGLDTYAGTENTNKYIFQVQPTVYVTANDMTKVYGETLTNANVTTTANATFVGKNNVEHNVNEYTNAFNEGAVSDYYNGSGRFTSAGWEKTATRTGGSKKASDDNNAIYDITATSDNYNLTTKGQASGYADATTKDGGTVEILRREINVKGSGNQTYGNKTIKDWTLTAELAGTQSGVTGEALVEENRDTLNNSTGTLSIKAGSSYAENQNGRTTADANENPYTDAVNMASVGFENGAGVNYTIVDATGDLKVNKASLTVNVGNAETVYGTPFKESDYDYAYSTETGKSLVNGDTKESLAAGLGKIDYDNEAALDGTTTGKWTKAVGDNYTLTFTNGTKSAFDALNNYNVTIVDGKAKVTPYTITKEDIVAANPTFTTVYGTTTTPVEVKFKGTNGDAEISNTATTTAYIYDADGNPVKTENVGDHAYDIKSTLTNSNYQFADGATIMIFEKTASVTPANLTIQIGDASTVYGTKFDETKYGYSYASGITNGDTEATLDAALGGMDYTNDAALDGTNGKWTKDVGDYALTGKGANSLTNYKVTYLDGKATVTPYTISREEVVNLDGTPLYTTKYGQKDAFGTATFKGVNGDGTFDLAITDSSALVNAGGKVTQDVGHNIYDTTVELSEAMNGNYQFADGATSKTFEKTASVTPAELTITTKDVETEYGTVKTTTSEVEGLTNGDLPTGFIYDYGNYGGAYLDGNTKTNDVNTYHFGTTLSGAEFLKNYTITGGEADVKIDPKDVTFFVSGTGNTLTDVTYTVDPDIDAQLAYGEHVDADYTPGNDLGSNQYGVVAHINGTPIVTGDVAGNYRYNYGGLITLSPTVPTKPDIDPHNPSNLDGSGSWTSNMGNHGVPGVERVAGLASAELPFFKVEAGQVSHYGTYDVAADPDKVRLEPTGKRLPEPNQPKTQYREYTKALTTTDGTGMFRMVYDGSTFNITPVDDGALALMRMGDVKNNVELSAEALHAGFSEMGILLEDLDGVYVHFDTMA